MKYEQWLNEWFAIYVKSAAKERTFEQYCMVAKIHIMPYLGGLEIAELTPFVLQKFIMELMKNGNKRTGKGLSPNFIKTIVSVVQNSLKTAHLAGHLPEYTANKIKRPKIVEKQVDCFTIAEQKKIESAALSAKKNKYRGIVLCLYTGLRIGELLALSWKDIDFEKSVLTVSRTCRDGSVNGKHVRISDAPKTENSRRKIPLSRAMIKMLKEMKKRSECEFVIADGNKPVFVRTYQRMFELLLKKLKLSHKGFHSLQHTFATRALECGMDVKSLSENLGHKNTTITLNRYAHSLWEHKAEMMHKLSKML